MTTPYSLAVNTFDREEIEAAKSVFDSGRLTMGNRVRAFEAEFAAWCGAKYALMVNSGSSANLLMVDAMLRRSDREGLWQPGDEVLVPALSWPTTVWPLVQLGLIPVFVDVDPKTLAIDLKSAESVLTPKTKGLFLIHVLGQVPDMSEYIKFCDKHGLNLLEDACESLGGHFDGKHVGNFGLMGSFSCYLSHHISTIEGGMIVTSDPALYDDLKSLRSHGWVRDRSDRPLWRERYPEFDDRFMFVTGGYNVRPTEIQGAIGSVQLRKLDYLLEEREALAHQVKNWLEEYAPMLRLIGSERLPPNRKTLERRSRTHSWMTLPFQLDPKATVTVEVLKKKMELMGVETRPILAGNLCRHPATQRFKTRSAAVLKQCDDLLAQGFMIGCHSILAPGALETLANAFQSLAKL